MALARPALGNAGRPGLEQRKTEAGVVGGAGGLGARLPFMGEASQVRQWGAELWRGTGRLVPLGSELVGQLVHLADS